MFILQYVQQNKTSDSDWFRLESNKEGQFKMKTYVVLNCIYLKNLLKVQSGLVNAGTFTIC